MGVCCIVFDIDGMLFEFFMNFLNIEKNNFLFFCFQYFKFSSRFKLFSTLKKKKLVSKKIFRGGGGAFFLEIQFFLISHFTFYAIFNINKNIEKFPFTYWLNGRWFLQIVERDSWNLYPLYSLVLILYLKCGGGGVMFFSHFMLFATFIENNFGNTKQLFLI